VARFRDDFLVGRLSLFPLVRRNQVAHQHAINRHRLNIAFDELVFVLDV
jgi:hypothetical protein